MDGRVFLVNVGTNASHPAKSPLFPGGTFELIPIPEALGMDGARAVRFTRELAQAALTDASSRPWRWSGVRSPL